MFLYSLYIFGVKDRVDKKELSIHFNLQNMAGEKKGVVWLENMYFLNLYLEKF